MQGPADETVGATFDPTLLQAARNKTLKVIEEAARRVRPGMTEDEAKRVIWDTQTALGGPKAWHPPQIRFGENTVLAFGQKGAANPALGENDIFFFDIGPIFDGHEGDVGRAFAVGDDPEMRRCCRDVELIWREVRDHWNANGVTGGELYRFAQERAGERGWLLCLQKANGHRIADFPHAARGRGSVEGFESRPAPNRWILEIQIRHPTRPFGAFHEDLLN
jgi:Xaa-Pro aminopeptidase